MFKALIILLLLAGCATQKKFDNNLKSWIGKDIKDFVATWGPPTDMFVFPDKSGAVYTYNWTGNRTVTAQQVHGTTFINSNQQKCTASVTTKNMIIVSYRWQGNCKAK